MCYMEYYSQMLEGVINEDGGGATNCSGVSASGNGSCGFIQPLSMVQRKEIYNTKPNKKKKNEPKYMKL